ncbi:glycosyltransferase family 2 protein [bacterium]|nr:MAG: glycosyltransferase family 2 protein [bacterium]
MNPLYFVAILVISLIYVWTVYNVPILVVGVRHLHMTKNKKQKLSYRSKDDLPSISVIVPVKDEESVVSRLLNALLKVDYPEEKMEIVVVEDGSVDKTAKICRGFAKEHPNQVKIISRNVSDGKPSALMEALKHIKGDIVGVFDADNVPEPDVLLRAANHFRDSSVVAVQGRVLAINADENMLTKFVAQEEAVRYDGFMGGKEALGLFVPLNGSCYFIKRDVLKAVGGWDTKALSEDMELAARLVHKGHKIKYASDVRSWQEYPASLTGFFKQRVRWFRGTMEVGFKYGKLLKNLNRMSLDAEVTLVGPFVFISCLIGYIIPLLSLMIPLKPDLLSLFLANVTSILTVVLLSAAGIAMIYGKKPRNIRNLLWMPFIFLYWILQNFIASYALVQILLRRPKRWLKTEKNGVIANSTFVLEKEHTYAFAPHNANPRNHS